MCGPHVAAPVSGADNGTSRAPSSAPAVDRQEKERKPLWLHYLNGPRHFVKVSNMQRSDNRASHRRTVCVRGKCHVCGMEGKGKALEDWAAGHSDEVGHNLAVKIWNTLSEQTQETHRSSQSLEAFCSLTTYSAPKHQKATNRLGKKICHVTNSCLTILITVY